MQLAFWEPDTDNNFEISQDDDDLRPNIGLVGEYLTAADLVERGCACSFAAAGLPYDLIVEWDGALFRVQVKSNARPQSHGSYRFRGTHAYAAEGWKSTGLDAYEGKCDLFAFVALDRRFILYTRVEGTPRQLTIRPERFTKEICDISFLAAIRA